MTSNLRSPRTQLDSSQKKKNQTNEINFQAFVPQEALRKAEIDTDESLQGRKLKVYLDVVDDRHRTELLAYVSSIDDLGPEAALNIQRLEPYRLVHVACPQYMDVIFSITKSFAWSTVLQQLLKPADSQKL